MKKQLGSTLLQKMEDSNFNKYTQKRLNTKVFSKESLFPQIKSDNTTNTTTNDYKFIGFGNNNGFGGAGAHGYFDFMPELNDIYSQTIGILTNGRRSFTDAFAAARKLGKSDFMFNGKRYTTEMSEHPNYTQKEYEDITIPMLRTIYYKSNGTPIDTTYSPGWIPDTIYTRGSGYTEQDLKNGYHHNIYGDNEIIEKEKSGGNISIKPENRGKFTAAANRAGKSVQEYARQILANKENYSKTLVKRANFAHNAAGWKHQVGSYLDTFFSNADKEKKGYNRDAMIQLDNYFIEQGLSEPQRQALLYNILIESGGAKVLGAHGNGYYGLVGWSPERYSQIKDKSLLGQAAYLVDTLRNGDGSMSWNHGGKGSGYDSWKNAKSAFWDKNSDYNAANNALVYGYIRPYDKVGRITGGENYFVKQQSGGVDLNPNSNTTLSERFKDRRESTNVIDARDLFQHQSSAPIEGLKALPSLFLISLGIEPSKVPNFLKSQYVKDWEEIERRKNELDAKILQYRNKKQSGGVDLDSYIRQNHTSKEVEWKHQAGDIISTLPIDNTEYIGSTTPIDNANVMYSLKNNDNVKNVHPTSQQHATEGGYDYQTGKFNDTVTFANTMYNIVLDDTRTRFPNMPEDYRQILAQTLTQQFAGESNWGRNLSNSYNIGGVKNTSNEYKAFNSYKDYLDGYWNTVQKPKLAKSHFDKGDYRLLDNAVDGFAENYIRYLGTKDKYFDTYEPAGTYYTANIDNYVANSKGANVRGRLKQKPAKHLEGNFIETPYLDDALYDTMYNIPKASQMSGIAGSVGNAANDIASLFLEGLANMDVKQQVGGTPIIAEHGEDILYPDGTVLKSVGKYHEYGDERQYRPDGQIDGNKHIITGNPEKDNAINGNMVKIHGKTYTTKSGKPFVFPSTMNQWGYMNRSVGNYFPQAHINNEILKRK